MFSALKVLVHGSAEATEHLKQHCLKNVCPHIYAPQIEESIDVTSDLCAYKVSSWSKTHKFLLNHLSNHSPLLSGSHCYLTCDIGSTFWEIDEQHLV